MVNIHLNVDGSPLLFLNIPNSDVVRLSLRPYKWIRYTMFSICGARGDISVTPNGQPVDYNSVLLVDDLYYNPLERCIFVDEAALNDRITSSNCVECPTFRQQIINRDGGCIVTLADKDLCEAAHLIPKSKGDEYIDKVTRDRSPCYEPSPPPISDINAVENGVLLRSDLHKWFGMGKVAFLMTPNYGLEPTDIPKFEQHSIHGTNYHITLHRLVKPSDTDLNQLLVISNHVSNPSANLINACGPHMDVQFQGLNPSLPTPPAIILDYLYGVAAYKLWRSNQEGVRNMMATHREQYKHIPLLPCPSPSPTAHEASVDFYNSQDHMPTASQEDGMIQAMDDLNMLLMRISGTTPQELADKRAKQMEEEEQAIQEKSRSKVMEWMKTRSTISSTNLSSNSAYHPGNNPPLF